MAIRVLLAVPSPLRDLLRQAIAMADDIEVAGAANTPLDVLVDAGAVRADVVVVGALAGRPAGIVTHLLGEYPEVRVLAVDEDAGRATLHFLQPREVALTETSPAGLLTAIRTFMHE